MLHDTHPAARWIEVSNQLASLSFDEIRHLTVVRSYFVYETCRRDFSHVHFAVFFFVYISHEFGTLV